MFQSNFAELQNFPLEHKAKT